MDMNNNQPVDDGVDKYTVQDTPMTISRRDFIRKSAEVAAMSLFGVVALDSIVDSVLSVIGEHAAARRLGVAAADALNSNGYNMDGVVSSTCSFTCSVGYNCPSDVSCPIDFTDSDCSRTAQYGCTIRQLVCGDDQGQGSFQCTNWFNCWGSGGNGSNVQCVSPAFKCNSQYPFHTYKMC